MGRHPVTMPRLPSLGMSVTAGVRRPRHLIALSAIVVASSASLDERTGPASVGVTDRRVAIVTDRSGLVDQSWWRRCRQDRRTAERLRVGVDVRTSSDCVQRIVSRAPTRCRLRPRKPAYGLSTAPTDLAGATPAAILPPTIFLRWLSANIAMWNTRQRSTSFDPVAFARCPSGPMSLPPTPTGLQETIGSGKAD